MSATTTITVPTDLSPRSTLAIILGARSFPKTDLSHPPSFERSALRFREYLIQEDGLGIPESNLLNLFDTSSSPDQIQEEIAEFLSGRRSTLEKQGTKPRDLIFYYVGHGSFSNPDQQYILAIRSTRKNYEGVSSVKIIDLGATLTEAALDLRRYLILDCCFAAAAAKSLMAPINDVVQQKTLAAFPVSGTTLLCASDAHDSAEAPPDLPETVFSGTMLSILFGGDATLETGLSIYTLGLLVRNRIRENYKNYSGLPEVHSPVQNEGNIAAIPLFPNAANRPRTLQGDIKILQERIQAFETELRSKSDSTALQERMQTFETELRSKGDTKALEARLQVLENEIKAIGEKLSTFLEVAADEPKTQHEIDASNALTNRTGRPNTTSTRNVIIAIAIAGAGFCISFLLMIFGFGNQFYGDIWGPALLAVGSALTGTVAFAQMRPVVFRMPSYLFGCAWGGSFLIFALLLQGLYCLMASRNILFMGVVGAAIGSGLAIVSRPFGSSISFKHVTTVALSWAAAWCFAWLATISFLFGKINTPEWHRAFLSNEFYHPYFTSYLPGFVIENSTVYFKYLDASTMQVLLRTTAQPYSGVSLIAVVLGTVCSSTLFWSYRSARSLVP